MTQKNWIAILLVCACILGCAYMFRYESLGRCGGDNSCQLMWDRWLQRKCFFMLSGPKLCTIEEVVKFQTSSASTQNTENLPTWDEAVANYDKKKSEPAPQAWLQFVPLGVPILVGLIAGGLRRNGWKWGVIALIITMSIIVGYASWQTDHLQPHIGKIIFGIAFYGGLFWLIRRWLRNRRARKAQDLR